MRRTRRLTVEDLTPDQAAIYHALPPDLQKSLLRILPVPEGDPRKARKIVDHAAFIGELVERLKMHQRDLREVAERVRARDGRIDLRSVLRPPDLPGARLRFLRPGHLHSGSGGGKPERRKSPRPSTRVAAAVAVRPGRRRRAPSADDGAEAPFGRDPLGQVYMPWGATAKGVPARPKGKYGQRQVEAFLALLREKPGLTDAEATAEFHRRRRR